MTAITVAPRLRANRIAARVSAVSHDRVAVAVLGGDIHLDRDPCPLLDRVAADEARVIAGAAGNDHDPAHLGDELRGELELGQIDGLEPGQAVGDRLRDRVGLLVDLLQGECLVSGLLGSVLVPGDLDHVARHRLPVGVDDSRPLGVDGDDLPVLEPEGGAGLGQERGDRGGDEGLALAEADDQRALLTCCDEAVGMLGVHGDEGVMAAELAEGGADRVGQVAAVVLLDQVSDDLGIGLGAESVALGHELAPQLRVVLDDPVEHDVDLVDAVAVRVRILLGDPPVRRPARVAEAGRRRRRGDRDRAGANRPSRPSSARRLARLPTARTDSIRPSSSSEMPAES